MEAMHEFVDTQLGQVSVTHTDDRVVVRFYANDPDRIVVRDFRFDGPVVVIGRDDA